MDMNVITMPRSDSLIVRFFELVLPERGPYAVAIKPTKANGFKPTIFASGLEEQAAILEEHDRDGFECYHACASYKEALNDPLSTPAGQKRLGRTKRNAAGAKSFWLDKDVGPDKPYKTKEAASTALAAFCKKLDLPMPLVVDSGGGLHVYWPLDRDSGAATWESYARGLKALCVKHGLHADPARTADITSVLRTPGTHNHKYTPPREVTCDPEFLRNVRPSPLERFRVFLDHAPAESRAAERIAGASTSAQELLGKIPDTLYRREDGRRLLDLVNLEPEYPPSYGAEIIQHCAQLREFQNKQGRIPEPQWYDVIGVLAYCKDGDALAHEISKGDERYTFEETQDKLDRQRQFGPTTCEQFSHHNANTCNACKHRSHISSPIQLGHVPRQEVAHTTGTTTQSARTMPRSWELTKGGARKSNSYINTVLALVELGIRFRHDVFHDKKIVEGDAIENLGAELSDPACRAIRDLIIARFAFDPGIANVQQAAERACEASRFDPVCDYLDALQWDGQLRLDRLLVDYLGAEDTPFNRAIGRKMLVAMVRRARQPGCKFDTMPVIEGVQGTGKSSALRILAGEENFSDQPLLHLDPRAQQEALKGKWLDESSELAGLRRADVEMVKAFLSKTSDDGRPAYGRYRCEQLRRCIFVGTTNDSTYLRDTTGNRRFWPVRTGRIDLDALQRDRDQLFAEAAVAERSCQPLTIPETLYKDAAHCRTAQAPLGPNRNGSRYKLMVCLAGRGRRRLIACHVDLALCFNHAWSEPMS
jgi:hypothetical protein